MRVYCKVLLAKLFKNAL